MLNNVKLSSRNAIVPKKIEKTKSQALKIVKCRKMLKKSFRNLTFFNFILIFIVEAYT